MEKENVKKFAKVMLIKCHKLYKCFDINISKIVITRHFYLIKVDCKWGKWDEWTTCSLTCETSRQKGIQSRERSILRNATKGGASCEGDTTEFQDCPGIPCPSNSNTILNILVLEVLRCFSNNIFLAFSITISFSMTHLN